MKITRSLSMAICAGLLTVGCASDGTGGGASASGGTKSGGQTSLGGSGSGGQVGSGGSGFGGNASGGTGGSASGGSGGNASGGNGGHIGGGGGASGGSAGSGAGGSGGSTGSAVGGSGSGGNAGAVGGGGRDGGTSDGDTVTDGKGGSGGSDASQDGGATGGGPGNGGSSAGGASTGGATGAGGMGSGGTTTSCTVTPVTPNATQQVKNVLCYLYSQYGNHVLSGQQETSWSNPTGDITWYTSNGMKPPAILGGDFLYHDGGSCTTKTATTQRAIDYWNAGGLTMIRYHMGLPASGLTCADDCYQGANCAEPSNGSPSASFFTNVITSGTPENTSLNAKLDYVAVQIKAMADANVPVLLAMYHETQSNGWFWWAMTTSGSSFVSLWTYTFDYLTKTKGLTNIIWLMPFSGSVPSAFYPGKSYLDISGPDTYDTNQPFTSLYSSAKGVIGSTIPIPLHETGLIPTPSAMFPTAAPWLLFNIWATYQSDGSHNTLANIQSVYADSHVVTRDEIPNLQ